MGRLVALSVMASPFCDVRYGKQELVVVTWPGHGKLLLRLYTKEWTLYRTCRGGHFKCIPELCSDWQGVPFFGEKAVDRYKEILCYCQGCKRDIFGKAFSRRFCLLSRACADKILHIGEWICLSICI